MTRFNQYSISKLLIATALASVVIALYVSHRTVVSRQTVAVGFFGLGPLDYATAHERLIQELDRTKYIQIEEPTWATDRVTSASAGVASDRSDWFAVDKNGARNYVHISSARGGFAVDVWIYKRRLEHQSIYRENLLTNELVSELSAWWRTWLSENRNNPKNGK